MPCAKVLRLGTKDQAAKVLFGEAHKGAHEDAEKGSISCLKWIRFAVGVGIIWNDFSESCCQRFRFYKDQEYGQRLLLPSDWFYR
jgi:hypothetical protein